MRPISILVIVSPVVGLACLARALNNRSAFGRSAAGRMDKIDNISILLESGPCESNN